MLFIYWSSSRHCRYGGVNWICRGVTIEFCLLLLVFHVVDVWRHWMVCFGELISGGGVQFVHSEPFSSGDLGQLLCVASPPFSAGNLITAFSAASFLSLQWVRTCAQRKKLLHRVGATMFGASYAPCAWVLPVGELERRKEKNSKPVHSVKVDDRRSVKKYTHGLRLYMSSLFFIIW